MKALIKHPGGKPEAIEIENELKELQKAVDGYIEVVPFSVANSILAVIDEEGKLKGKEINFILHGDAICGTVLFVSDSEETFESLDRDQIAFIEGQFI